MRGFAKAKRPLMWKPGMADIFAILSGQTVMKVTAITIVVFHFSATGNPFHFPVFYFGNDKCCSNVTGQWLGSCILGSIWVNSGYFPDLPFLAHFWFLHSTHLFVKCLCFHQYWLKQPALDRSGVWILCPLKLPDKSKTIILKTMENILFILTQKNIRTYIQYVLSDPISAIVWMDTLIIHSFCWVFSGSGYREMPCKEHIANACIFLFPDDGRRIVIYAPQSGCLFPKSFWIRNLYTF